MPFTKIGESTEMNTAKYFCNDKGALIGPLPNPDCTLPRPVKINIFADLR